LPFQYCIAHPCTIPLQPSTAPPWQIDVLKSERPQLLLNCCKPMTTVILVSRSHRQSREMLKVMALYYRLLGERVKAKVNAHEIEMGNLRSPRADDWPGKSIAWIPANRVLPARQRHNPAHGGFMEQDLEAAMESPRKQERSHCVDLMRASKMQPQPRRAASIAAMSIFFICIIVSNARLAAAESGSVSAFVRAIGVICQDNPHLSLHQPHALSWPPLPTIAFQ
jgi:hypothetical protein